MNRGARRQRIFIAEEDYHLFEWLLSDVVQRLGIRIHGYALMPNHVHLMVESADNLPRAMQFVFAQYSRQINQRYGWDGPIWKGRYRNRLVQDDNYWRHLLAYIHLNPVRAGMAKLPDYCPFTSHPAYAGQVMPPPWLTTSELIRSFGSQVKLVQYIDEVCRGREAEPAGFDGAALWKVEGQQTAEVRKATLTKALVELQARVGPLSKLCAGVPGEAHSAPRWVSAWWLIREAGLSRAQVAGILGAHERTITKWVRRVVHEGGVDGPIADARKLLLDIDLD